MIHKYTGFITAAFLLSSLFINAQIKELTIGDKIPNIELNQISSYKSSKAKLYDFKSDLLIIDFWATWCGPCIAMFPKADSIEKVLNHKVRFLPVSNENMKKVNSFLKSMNATKKINAFSVVEDTILNQFFRYQTLPHYVWIDKGGTIVAITDKVEITVNNLQSAIAGNYVGIKMKKESERSMDIMRTAFNEAVYIIYGDDTANKRSELLNKDKIMYRSVFTSQIPGVVRGFSHWERNSYTFINAAPLLLLKEYWGLKKKYNYNVNEFLGEGRTVIEVNDTMTIYRISGGYLNYLHNPRAWQEWGNKYSICYELVVPDSMSIERKEELMEQDLRRYFHDLYKISFHIEKRRVKRLILKSISSNDKLTASGGEPVEEYTRYSFNIQNRPFRYFVTDLKDIYRNSYPIVNGTDMYGKMIDIKLGTNILDYNLLNAQLKNYGLQLFLEESEMDVLVVTDAN